MEEIWKDVVGYEGYYQVSNLGRVRSLDRIASNGRKIKGKILSTKVNTPPYYPRVSLSVNGKMKLVQVHRLVAQAFVYNPDPEHKTQVGHKDESRTNNRADNLEWVTPKENSNMPLHRERVSKANEGKVLSAETKSKISLSQKGKYKGEKNPFYNKHHTNEAKKKMSDIKKMTYQGGNHPQAKKVICDNIVYGSAVEASEALNINRNTLKCWLNGSNKMPKEWKDRGLRYFDGGKNELL